ncbi:hypothetical protein [Halobellus limi]|uniref:Uncharacterized protein n=1 Tax=Halobellus limi TaxID=699433 RepID=A0A1H5ZM50_9EURY|nr:hypothetical protein [Halobellus limi]SEG36446.1 hypothetical protein SAMN04488133_2028 [Halobellus limi]
MASITYETPDGIETKEDVSVSYDEEEQHYTIQEDNSEMETLIPRERVYSVEQEQIQGGGTTFPT